ncbi:MAG TPA: hypothetical protein VHE35_36265 [Kofleriaceae bacterium]|nr:hypothetical protein [Kofleriaceae bacterium]
MSGTPREPASSVAGAGVVREAAGGAGGPEAASGVVDARDLEAERPIPDLLDRRGRLRRFGIAAALATLAAVGGASLACWLARDDLESGRGYITDGADRFVAFFVAATWAAAYVVVRGWLERRARLRDGLVPGATALVRPPARRRR